MAILKIISHGKTNAGKRRVLQYVLDPKKTNPDLCAVSGDFQAEEITPQTVYKSCALTRALFNKVSLGGRTYTHGTIAFAPGEISPEDAAEFAEEKVADDLTGFGLQDENGEDIVEETESDEFYSDDENI